MATTMYLLTAPQYGPTDTECSCCLHTVPGCPSQAEYYSLEGTADIQQAVQRVASAFGHSPRKRFLLTMYTKTTDHGDAVMENPAR